jgi:arginyl-tRNA synthetase
LTTYAQELARAFHAFYTQCHVRTDDPALRAARLALSRATRQTLANALGLLGVSAPERMEREPEEGSA